MPATEKQITVSYIDYAAYDDNGNLIAELVAVPDNRWRFWRRELSWDVPDFGHAAQAFKWYPDAKWRAQLFITIHAGEFQG